MKRLSIFPSVAFGAVLATIALFAFTADAQDLTVTEISPHVVVFGTAAGNIVASVGSDGALLVGIPSVASTQQINRVLAERTKSPLRYVVIAPQKPGEEEGDAGWERVGAFVVMQENALGEIGGHAMGAPGALPKRLIDLGVDRPRVSFSEVLSFDLNGEAIHVIHQPPAYSNADSIVHFHVANCVYFGKVFPGDGYADIDPLRGGSLKGFLQILGPWTGDSLKVVPERGKVVTGAEVEAFVQMMTTVRDRVQRMIEVGQTEEQIIDSHPTAEFDTRWGHGRVTPDAFVRSVYLSLKS